MSRPAALVTSVTVSEQILLIWCHKNSAGLAEVLAEC
jgi:hypothetical protein